MNPDLEKKIKNLCELIEHETHERLMATGFQILVDSSQKEGRRTYKEIGYSPDHKLFVRIYESCSRGSNSVKYFVEKETGIIYGADGWKKPNIKRAYGTLDTIHEWDWSNYYAESKLGLSTLVPADQRRKAKKP